MAEWHSKLPGTEVYHNNRKCTIGNNIERKNFVSGRGGKRRLCEECKRLNQKR
jgi:hypothetical protein